MKLAALALAWAALLVASCGPSASPYCEAACDCMGCDDRARNDCNDTLGDARHRADLSSCSGAFDAYVACVADGLTCTASVPTVTGCDAEEDALYECAGDVGFGKTGCTAAVEIYAAKYESCGVELPEGTGAVPDCTPLRSKRAACQAACVEGATCDAITGNDTAASVALNTCIEDCG